MEKYWRGMTKDGGIVSEALGAQWGEHELTTLEFVLNDQRITLPKGHEYIQGKTASANLLSGECEIESRYIGVKLGNNIVKIRIDEKTNNISLEID